MAWHGANMKPIIIGQHVRRACVRAWSCDVVAWLMNGTFGCPLMIICRDQVINRERKGDYLGKTVQVVPHVTDAIQDWIERVAHVTSEQPGLLRFA